MSQHDRLPPFNSSVDWKRNSFGRTSRVGWTFEVLPFWEAQAIYDSLTSTNWMFVPAARDSSPAQDVALADVPTLHCPSEPGSPMTTTSWNIQTRDGKVLFAGVGSSVMGASYGMIAPVPGDYEINAETEVLQHADGERHILHEGAFFGTRYATNGQDHSNAEESWRFKRAKVSYIEDGLSKTILLSETVLQSEVRRWDFAWLFRDVYWSYPAENVRGAMWSNHRSGRQTAMADGSVPLVRSDVDSRVLALLVGRQNGVIDSVKIKK